MGLIGNRDNHLLDCTTMAAVAASIRGVGAAGAETMSGRRRRVEIPKPGERRQMKVKHLKIMYRHPCKAL